MQSSQKSKKSGQAKRVFGGIMLGISALALAAFVIPNEYFTPVTDSEFTKQLKEKTIAYNKQRTEERVYLQFDKPMYEPGEDIWFAAYLRDGQSLKPSVVSDILYVELIDPKGSVAKKITLIAKDGKVAGDFQLDPELPGGMYKVRAYTNWMKNDETLAFEKEVQVQDVVLPNLKMKLEYEKKGFGPGDEVIARLQLNTNENQPLSNYDIKYVCEVDGKKVVEKADMTDDEGTKIIRFNLPDKLESNDGLLNVMISYNGNTESVSRSVPILLNKIGLSFFPEGGDMVSGLEGNVAFRATNEWGRPADIDGIVITEKGSKVASFSSFHQGMGAFKLIPQSGEKYFAKITRPSGIGKIYELPAVLDSGYALSVDASRKGEMSAVIHTTKEEELHVVAQVRGKILYTNTIKAFKGANKVVFPSSKFPAGVVQVTVFDANGTAQCERLAFVNRDRQLNVSVETEKEKYLPREKIKMNITVKDEKGIPVPANLSMSVANDQFLSFANSKAGNILSQLLFQQDLKEKIEDPSFYFDKKEAKSEKALDYLLMTVGWRHFTWENVQKQEFAPFQFVAEKAIVSGVVYDAYKNKPVPYAVVKTQNGKVFKADANGKFELKGLEMYEPVILTFTAPDYTENQQAVADYNQNLTAYIYSVADVKKNPYYFNARNRGRAGAGQVAEEDAAAFEWAPQMAVGNNNGAGHFVVKNVMAKPGKAGAGNQQAVKFAGVEVEKAKMAKDVAAKAEEQKMNALGKKNQEADRKKVVNNNGPMAMGANVNFAAGRANLNNGWNNNLNGLDMDGDLFLNDWNGGQQATHTYYRARKFAAPVYAKEEKTEARTDFRNLIYWNPEIKIDDNGKGSVEFYASDDITSFRAVVEGVGNNGLVGRSEKAIFTQLPFAMTTKIPVEVATEDIVSIPLTLKNNTNGPLGGVLTITAPDGLQEMVKIPQVQTIMPGSAKTIFLDYKVLNKIGSGDFTVSFKSCGLTDAFTQTIKVAPKGFPVTASFSGQEKEKEYSFTLSNMVSGSLQAKVTAYPNVVNDLMKGVEGILREPGGCFEQTSMSSYPNAMVLDYLKTTGNKDDKLMASATGLLDRGYKRLVTFETKEKGYEWFGSNPGHEALTAYGLMQFADMKRVGEQVDQEMLDRTANWLMAKKDGNGGFARNARALDNFGRASKEITDAYIVYSLSEAGYKDIKKEFNAAYSEAQKGDPYVMALVANAAYNLMENAKGDNLVSALVSKQDKDGKWNGAKHSITYSTGQSLQIETSSLAIMALLKSGKNTQEMISGVKWLMSSRNGYGAFGNTQGTVLALKALTEFAKFSKKTNEDGTIVVYVDGKKAAEKFYKAGTKEAIEIDGIEKMIKGEGAHDIKVKFEGTKEALPYSVAVSWNTFLPNSNQECVVDLKTKISAQTANVGETVRLSATVSNKKNEGIPSTMVIVGIPAGFTVQPWQLKELQDKKVFDYYEVTGNKIAIYYRCMQPSAVKVINLDLKAEMPGEYDAPAASAYLYYTNEFKTWSGVERITVKKG